MQENKRLTNEGNGVELSQASAGPEIGRADIVELSDDQAEAVAGGTGGSMSFQSMAYLDTPVRPYIAWSNCYNGCQLPHESKSLWARAAGGPGGSTKIDVKCYNCGTLYNTIENANMPQSREQDESPALC